jgi:hypothetical protein
MYVLLPLRSHTVVLHSIHVTDGQDNVLFSFAVKGMAKLLPVGEQRRPLEFIQVRFVSIGTR